MHNILGCRGTCLGNPPAWHRVLPGPSGPEPQKSPKGCPGPEAPGSPRVLEECAPESEKSPKKQLRTLFGLFSDSGAHSSGTLELPRAGSPGTPFRTLFGLFWGSGPEGPGSTLCQAGGFPTLAIVFHKRDCLQGMSRHMIDNHCLEHRCLSERFCLAISCCNWNGINSIDGQPSDL